MFIQSSTSKEQAVISFSIEKAQIYGIYHVLSRRQDKPKHVRPQKLTGDMSSPVIIRPNKFHFDTTNHVILKISNNFIILIATAKVGHVNLRSSYKKVITKRHLKRVSLCFCKLKDTSFQKIADSLSQMLGTTMVILLRDPKLGMDQCYYDIRYITIFLFLCRIMVFLYHHIVYPQLTLSPSKQFTTQCTLQCPIPHCNRNRWCQIKCFRFWVRPIRRVRHER